MRTRGLELSGVTSCHRLSSDSGFRLIEALRQAIEGGIPELAVCWSRQPEVLAGCLGQLCDPLAFACPSERLDRCELSWVLQEEMRSPIKSCSELRSRSVPAWLCIRAPWGMLRVPITDQSPIMGGIGL